MFGQFQRFCRVAKQIGIITFLVFVITSDMPVIERELAREIVWQRGKMLVQGSL